MLYFTGSRIKKGQLRKAIFSTKTTFTNNGWFLNNVPCLTNEKT